METIRPGSRLMMMAAAIAGMATRGVVDEQAAKEARNLAAERRASRRETPTQYRPHMNGSRLYKPNGAREIARRRRQREKIEAKTTARESAS